MPNGYNQLHLTPLYDILNKVYLEAVIQPEPQKDEIDALIELVRRNTFKEKTLIIGDRGYESYNLLAHLAEKENLDFLIRIKNNRSAMREVARLPMLELDTVIRFTVSTTQTKEDKQKKPSRIAREAVIRQPEEWIHAYRVNFKMAAALCREYFRTEGADYEKLLEEIGRHTVPVRPDRQNKQALKAKGFAGFTYRVLS